MAGVYFSAFSADTAGAGLDSCGLSYISDFLSKQGSSSSSPFCKDNSGCEDLTPDDGLCCPVKDGTFLACCNGGGMDLWDDTAHISGKKIFTYAGAQDPWWDNTQKGGLLYQNLYKASVASMFDMQHSHAWQSIMGPVSECDIVNVQAYDLAGEILQHIYGKIHRDSFKSSHLHVVDQGQYLPAGVSTLAEIGLGQHAGAYVPSACQMADSTCSLHVHFHGCDNEWEGKCGHQDVISSGFNEWAEASKIIVLYPQLAYIPLPCGIPDCSCWDYGPGDGGSFPFFYGEGKANKQLQLVANMAAALLKNPTAVLLPLWASNSSRIVGATWHV